MVMYMNELKGKSELNMDAAKLMLEHSYYDSVCHPAYYACLQLMSHKLIRKGIDLEKQGLLSSSQYRGNSHKAILSEIRKCIEIDDYKDEVRYDKSVKKLKEMRERADYKLSRIKREESEKCINMAEFVIGIINSIRV